MTIHDYTFSGSGAIETCFLKLLIVAELTHSAGREFQLSMTLLLNIEFNIEFSYNYDIPTYSVKIV